MNTGLTFLTAVLAAYLLGAIPFGLLIARSRGVDIRRAGSRNIGATNVMRSVGKVWGLLTLLLDALKGVVPTAGFPALLAWLSVAPGNTPLLKIACGTAAILGHNFPLYLRFKGGKGVATTAGVLAGLAPLALLAGLGCFAVVFGISRYVSLGSITAAVVVPLVSIPLYGGDGPLVPCVLGLLGLLVIWRHKANIARLLNGTESRITSGRKKR